MALTRGSGHEDEQMQPPIERGDQVPASRQPGTAEDLQQAEEASFARFTKGQNAFVDPEAGDKVEAEGTQDGAHPHDMTQNQFALGKPVKVL